MQSSAPWVPAWVARPRLLLVDGIRDLITAMQCHSVRRYVGNGTPGPARGRLRHGFYGHDKLGCDVARADIGAFTAAQVDDDRCVGAACAISN
jgi:hypothetical protein